MKKKLKILLLSNKFTVGGGERKVEMFHKGFNNKYFDKYFVYYEQRSDICKKTKDNKYIISENELLNFIKKNKIDILYSFTSKLSQNTIDKVKTKSVFLKNVNFTSLYSNRKNELNIVISKSEYLKLKGIHHEQLKKNIKVIYNPIDTKKWINLSKDKTNNHKDFFKNKKIKLIVGRLARSEFSTWDFLILATLLKLNFKRNYDYGFIFAGIPKIYIWAFQIFLTSKFKKNIFILPELKTSNELGKFYNTLDVFWQASTVGESFCNVVLESLCFKVPVIVDIKEFYKYGEVPNQKLSGAQFESLDYNQNCLYANYPSSMIKNLIYFENKENREKFGKHGYDKVKKIYDLKYASIYTEKYIFLEAFKKGFISKIPDYYKKINTSPTNKEVLDYKKEYLKKINYSKQIEKINFINKIFYLVFKKIWNIIGFCYLIIRFLGRKVNLDIEKKEIFK